MRTERQRRAQQMRDIVRANEVRTGDVARVRKVAEVTARLRGETRPTLHTLNIRTTAHANFATFLNDEMDRMLYELLSAPHRTHDDIVDARP